MKEFDPGILGTYSERLKDPRKMENVENVLHFPIHDQHLLLALHGVSGKEAPSGGDLPKARVVIDALKERLISVATADGQTARLGLFFTNANPFGNHFDLTAGIFPIGTEITEYVIRPDIYADTWQDLGFISITDTSTTGDPFIITNYKDPPSLLFFKKFPFDPNQPYQVDLPEEAAGAFHYLGKPEVQDKALEQNVIDRAMWYAKVKSQKPLLYTQEGLHEFIKENHIEDRYYELYKYYHTRFRYPVEFEAK